MNENNFSNQNNYNGGSSWESGTPNNTVNSGYQNSYNGGMQGSYQNPNPSMTPQYQNLNASEVTPSVPPTEEPKKSNNKVMIAIIIILLILIFAIIGIWLFNRKNEKNIYTVIFNTNGGNEIASQKIEEGNKVSKPTDPTKEEYVFKYWTLSDTEYDFNTPVTKNITLDATWGKDEGASPKVEKYTITFNSDGGSTVYSITVNENQIVNRPNDPTKEGYVFKYWTLNDTEYDFNTPVIENITLKAVWEEEKIENKNFTVTFDSDGGSEVESQIIKYNQKATAPKNPTKSGYVFLDWTLNNKIYSFSTKVTSDITLKATWAKEGDYTITFNSDGGSEVESQTVKAGKLVTKPANPTKEEKEFKEWQLNGKAYDFNTKVSQNITLKAVWQTPKYTVTFDTAGGSSIKSQSIELNKKATKPSNPTKTGHTFKGWYIDDEEFDFETPITEAITITAKWEANKYLVTFDSDGGSEVASQEIEYNGTVTEPRTNPTKAGYSFEYWQLNNKKYVFSTKVTSAITLKAKWTKVEYTFKAKPVDQYSPDRIIEVYENDVKIHYSQIKIGNNILCPSEGTGVNQYDIPATITVILTNGNSVTATRSE